MKPADARKYRWALKNLGNAVKEDDILAEELKSAIKCDDYDVCSFISSGPNSPAILVLKKDGKAVATMEISNGHLRRMKSQIGWWKDFHSGAMMAFSHGNKP